MKDKQRVLLQKCIAEFAGTMLLTFSILSSITSTAVSYTNVVWTHGFAIFNLALIFGPISGGHFNPAVTLAFLLRLKDRISFFDCICYMSAQLFGGIIAGFLNHGMFSKYYLDLPKAANDSNNIAPLANWDSDNLGSINMFFFEALGTALLVLTVLMSSNKNNIFIRDASSSFFGAIAIAGMITWIGFMGILYYAGINPARELGPRIAGACIYGGSVAFVPYAWIPILGPFAGAIVATVVFEAISRMYGTSV